jgi:bacteriocin-like protein
VEKIMSKTNGSSRDELTINELDAVSGRNNKGFIEITEDELKQVTGGTSKLPGRHKAAEVTLTRGII